MRCDKFSREQSAANFATGDVKNMTQLTAAEKRVIALVSRARTNKEIAAVLGISPATVKRHMENILRKLHLKNRVEAAIYELRNIGCPRGSNLPCPLEMSQEEKNFTGEKWAV
jgi:DNA-binding CsgD family transcriptional regulator